MEEIIMSTITSELDRDVLTLTFVTEFETDAERVWQVWEDPRLLERWWGPPTWPATFTQHELAPGARSKYFMTGPDGSKGHGWWGVIAVEAPRSVEFDNGFADEAGEPDPGSQPSRVEVDLDELGSRTRMTTVVRFVDAEQLDQMITMGMQEGMTLAMGQIQDLLLND
jgi:uncharacterized protein YndB with AHSA1/START domain